MIIQDVPDSDEELFHQFLTKPFDIALSPATTSQFLVHTSVMKDFGINLSRSSYIDFLEMSSILSRNRLQSRPLLQCFRCFDINIWILIAISILSISFISKLRQQSAHSVFEYIWNYSITLLKVNFQHFIKKSFKKCKIIITAWIFVSIFQYNIFVILFRRYGFTDTNHKNRFD